MRALAVLVLVASCRGSEPFERARLEAVVAAVRPRVTEANKLNTLMLAESLVPATLGPDPAVHGRGDGRGLGRAEIDDAHHLAVSIETFDQGHAGESGFLYTDPGFADADLEAVRRDSQHETRIDDHWVRWVFDLDCRSAARATAGTARTPGHPGRPLCIRRIEAPSRESDTRRVSVVYPAHRGPFARVGYTACIHCVSGCAGPRRAARDIRRVSIVYRAGRGHPGGAGYTMCHHRVSRLIGTTPAAPDTQCVTIVYPSCADPAAIAGYTPCIRVSRP